MDYPPKPNPAIDPYAQFYYAQPSSYAHYPYYPPPQHQNPNPNLADPQTAPEFNGIPSVQFHDGPQPLGVESYATMNSYHHLHAGIEAQSTVAYGQQQTQMGALAASTTTYYQDPNVLTQNWAEKEVIQQYGAVPVSHAAARIWPPNATESLVSANPNPIYWTNPVVQHPNGVMRRKAKKTKIVQSVWCEVCQIDCNSKDVLDQHKLGKKHKKNLEKLEEPKRSTNAPTSVPAPVNNPVIGPQENPSDDEGKSVSIQQSKNKAAPSSEDLETKRRKIVESGAAIDEVRVCLICNVACNSQTVLNYHLAGQKHTSMMKNRQLELQPLDPKL